MKRFIAGANCPQCHTSDTLFFQASDKNTIFCSRCDYQDKRQENILKEYGENKTKGKNIEENIKWH